MTINVSVAEALDKLSILEIKLHHITDEAKCENIKKEANYLHKIISTELDYDFSSEEYRSLLEVNGEIWELEEKLRELEEAEDFQIVFVKKARLIYTTNDKRAKIKKEINLKYGSQFIEEKSYV